MFKLLKILSLALFVAGLLSFAYPVLAQGRIGASSSDCHKGNVYCEYPGKCHDYVDSNNDKYCDRSIPSTGTSTTSVNNSSNNQNAVTSTASSVPTTVDNSTSATVNAPQNGQSNVSKYNVLLVFIIVVIAYGTTYVLSLTNIIKTLLHRRIWNIALLVITIIMLVLSLLITLRGEYNLTIQLPFDLTFWHVETGIIMGIIAAFHMAWHWRYFFRIKPAANA